MCSSGETEKRVRKFPRWLKKRMPAAGEAERIRNLLKGLKLHTVCQEAHCPNACECFARGTATFMILGDVCTRNCAFCAVHHGTPEPPSEDEPERVAEAAAHMELQHVVVTSVTRDDLPGGGSKQFARTVRALHRLDGVRVEVLTPDFQGCEEDIDRVLGAAPEVFNHNVETVPRLYTEVRPMADYERSLNVLQRASEHPEGPIVKSGLMVGLGEREDELEQVFRDLLEAGCQMLTIGQYLAPSDRHHPVVEFIPPDSFQWMKRRALDMGFEAVAAEPFVRSSYRAGEMASRLLEDEEG